jgi:diaminohydroxyphosphoribosylaminopyrimidine deaminase / 5-amino-6-(5-phosphoribosylamino)uracil reductase
LELAQARRGFCSPNPSVGAVLVRGGEILMESTHWAAGHPHAEVGALAGVAHDTCRDATLYVSLEPCCHYGRTPPCTSLIIEKGIQNVVFGFLDPDPRVSGKGMKALQEAGVLVTHLRLPEVEAFYESYRFWTLNQLPFVTAKIAVSLDGKIADPTGRPVPLTGPSANRLTHEKRLRADCLLTTAQTILSDDPQMNARLGSLVEAKPVVILDRRGRTPVSSKIFKTASKVLLCVGPQVPKAQREAYVAHGAEVLDFSEHQDALPVSEILARLGQRGFHDLWIEAGGVFFSHLLSHRLLQKAYIYVAPVVVGPEGAPAFLDPDLLERAEVSWVGYGRDAVGEFTFKLQEPLHAALKPL